MPSRMAPIMRAPDPLLYLPAADVPVVPHPPPAGKVAEQQTVAPPALDIMVRSSMQGTPSDAAGSPLSQRAPLVSSVRAARRSAQQKTIPGGPEGAQPATISVTPGRTAVASGQTLSTQDISLPFLSPLPPALPGGGGALSVVGGTGAASAVLLLLGSLLLMAWEPVRRRSDLPHSAPFRCVPVPPG
jgi:hypothetical protein